MSTNHCAIRPARIEDAAELARLNGLFNGAGGRDAAGIARSLAENAGELALVAEAEGGVALAGFCCAQLMDSLCYPIRFAEITELFVEDHDRRRGIGAGLLLAMERELRARGATHFHILTGEHNAPAQALYEAKGYRRSGEVLLDKDVE